MNLTIYKWLIKELINRLKNDNNDDYDDFYLNKLKWIIYTMSESYNSNIMSNVWESFTIVLNLSFVSNISFKISLILLFNYNNIPNQIYIKNNNIFKWSN